MCVCLPSPCQTRALSSGLQAVGEGVFKTYQVYYYSYMYVVNPSLSINMNRSCPIAHFFAQVRGGSAGLIVQTEDFRIFRTFKETTTSYLFAQGLMIRQCYDPSLYVRRPFHCCLVNHFHSLLSHCMVLHGHLYCCCCAHKPLQLLNVNCDVLPWHPGPKRTVYTELVPPHQATDFPNMHTRAAGCVSVRSDRVHSEYAATAVLVERSKLRRPSGIARKLLSAAWR